MLQKSGVGKIPGCPAYRLEDVEAMAEEQIDLS
jgi:hypothetical protein